MKMVRLITPNLLLQADNFLKDGSLKKLVEPVGRLWFYDGEENSSF
jgi:hypothetical protein